MQKYLFKFVLHIIIAFSPIIYFFKYRNYKLHKRFDKESFLDLSFDDEKLERIKKAYLQSKIDQKKIKEPYKIGDFWNNIIQSSFLPLINSINDGSNLKIKKLFANFQRESLGGHDHFFLRKYFFYSYQYVNTFHEYFKIYNGLGKKFEDLRFLNIGNSCGIRNKDSKINMESIRYNYYAEEVYSLLSDFKHPIVAEIGGGYGEQGFSFISKFDSKITYLLFDIPEMLLIASYFLCKAFPNKKILLYGEGDVSKIDFREWDIILMPNFELNKLPKESVDLFFNSCSFSEMKPSTISAYLLDIERSCKNYFLSINLYKLISYDDGKINPNMPDSKIDLNYKRFKLIYKHPRLFSRVEDRLYYLFSKSKHFACLYQRTS